MTQEQKFHIIREWAKKHNIHISNYTDKELLEDAWFSYSNNYKIEYVPDEIDVMQNIKRFWLQNVGLKSLPDTLCNIKTIDELSVDRNKLTSLPSCIGNLRKLAYLDVEDNKLTELPKSIERLKYLVMLRSDNNKLTHLPANIGKLKNLDRLFLSNNPISELPESLQECNSLEILDLRGTAIKTPPKWLEEMPSLKCVEGFNITLHFQKLLQTQEYGAMQIKFRELFNQDMTEEQIKQKRSGIIGDESMPLGKFIWSKDWNSIEYYVQWLPHYRGDSHGIIYKNGHHESLSTLPQMGEVTQSEIKLREQLTKKGLLKIW
jgi:hypothetical protein